MNVINNRMVKDYTEYEAQCKIDALFDYKFNLQRLNPITSRQRVQDINDEIVFYIRIRNEIRKSLLIIN